MEDTSFSFSLLSVLSLLKNIIPHLCKENYLTPGENLFVALRYLPLRQHTL